MCDDEYTHHRYYAWDVKVWDVVRRASIGSFCFFTMYTPSSDYSPLEQQAHVCLGFTSELRGARITLGAPLKCASINRASPEVPEPLASNPCAGDSSGAHSVGGLRVMLSSDPHNSMSIFSPALFAVPSRESGDVRELWRKQHA